MDFASGVSPDDRGSMRPQNRIIRGAVPSLPAFRTIGDMQRASAERAPDRIFLRQRGADGWRSLSHGKAFEIAQRVGYTLLSLGLSQERPLAILSGNSIDHAVVALGAMLAGVPVAPVSTAYSQLGDLGRLRSLFEILTPGLVYAEDGAAYRRGLALAAELGIPTLVSVAADDVPPSWRLDELLAVGHGASLPTVASDDIAKVLFTSGSTGVPKGVVVTHAMMLSNQEALLQVWPFLAEEPPALVDWLPWNHVFGGNLVFNCALRNAGTLVIDEGRPVPGQFDRSMRNLLDEPPTVHFGVPAGFMALVQELQKDEAAARRYFSRLRASFTAGAALPLAIWTQYRDLAARHARPDFRLFVGWGATETAPVASITSPDNDRPDNIGVPFPGAEIKLVPDQDKVEIRVRGPMVTPGYWRRPDLTREAFDEEGFYRIGDAGKLLDPARPEKGILFDGRVAENFKLVTGTWVQVGKIRVAAISVGAPVIQDAVVTGQDREEVGLLVFPSLAGCRAVAGLPDASLDELAGHPAVRATVAKALAALGGGGSSSSIRRALLLTEPASMEAGEITDKGYLNQRAVLRARSALVERLYADPPDPGLIHPTP